MEHSKVNEVLFLNTSNKIKIKKFYPTKIVPLKFHSLQYNICPNFSFLNFNYFEKKNMTRLQLMKHIMECPNVIFYLFGNDNKCKIMNKNIVSTLSVTFYLLKKSITFYAPSIDLSWVGVAIHVKSYHVCVVLR